MRILTWLTLPAILLAPQASFAATCHSPDPEKVVHMYQIYLESGKMPKTRTVNTVNAGKTIKLEGEVQGLMNYEECWKRKPPCDEPADYQVVPIESLSSVGEITHSYGGDNNKLLLECVMKIGASGTYKAKNKP